MCDRYVLTAPVRILEQRFEADVSDIVDYKPNYNASRGAMMPVVSTLNPRKFMYMRFGYTPAGNDKDVYIVNARAEGDYNKENDPTNFRKKGIQGKPYFRTQIRTKRCIVPADCFVEGTIQERLGKPYVVYLKDRRPFSFAGLWDAWCSPHTGDMIYGFCIITTVATPLLQKMPHHRSPVILPSRSAEKDWLNKDCHLGDILQYLEPYDNPHHPMNAYPISADIKSPKAEGRALLNPAGPLLLPEVNERFEWRPVEDERKGMSKKHENEWKATMKQIREKPGSLFNDDPPTSSSI